MDLHLMTIQFIHQVKIKTRIRRGNQEVVLVKKTL